MSRDTAADTNTAVRPPQREYEPIASAAHPPILSAAAVAAIAQRAESMIERSPLRIYAADDVLALCAQDAAWRALVEALLASLAAASRDGQANGVLLRWQGALNPCCDALFPASARAVAALQAAQAALAAGA